MIITHFYKKNNIFAPLTVVHGTAKIGVTAQRRNTFDIHYSINSNTKRYTL
jgi:hypothetical protein